MPPLPPTREQTILDGAARRLKLHPFHIPMLRNSVPYNGRAGCMRCRWCVGFPCEVDAKCGTQNTVIPTALATGHCELRTGAMVRAIERTAHGWRLTAGSAHNPRYEEADAVVLALPAAPAGRLLAGLPGAAAAASGLAEVATASMAIVTLAFTDTAFPAAPQGSGYLVPAVDGRAVKAVTFSTVKWPHLRAAAPGLQIIRCSVGRIGEETLLHRDDADLAELARAELAEATGVRGRPAAARVTRWGGALPQYTVGHLGRVARIRDSVASQPGLAVCGAVYDGVGIPACIASAHAAAGRVLAALSPPGQ